MIETSGIVWHVNPPSQERLSSVISEIMIQGVKATKDRDRSTELDRLQYFEGKVDAFEFVLSCLTAQE